MTVLSFSPTEQAFLDNPEQFSTRKQRYLRYRIRQKMYVAAQQQRRGIDNDNGDYDDDDNSSSVVRISRGSNNSNERRTSGPEGLRSLDLRFSSPLSPIALGARAGSEDRRDILTTLRVQT